MAEYSEVENGYDTNTKPATIGYRINPDAGYTDTMVPGKEIFDNITGDFGLNKLSVLNQLNPLILLENSG